MPRTLGRRTAPFLKDIGDLFGADNREITARGDSACGPLDILEDHQQGLAFRRDIQPALLGGGGEIEKIGLLDDQAAVNLFFPHTGLKFRILA